MGVTSAAHAQGEGEEEEGKVNPSERNPSDRQLFGAHPSSVSEGLGSEKRGFSGDEEHQLISAHLSSHSGAHPSIDESSLVEEGFSDGAHPAASLLSDMSRLLEEINAIGAHLSSNYSAHPSIPGKKRGERLKLVNEIQKLERFSDEKLFSAHFSSQNSAHPSFLCIKTSLDDETDEISAHLSSNSGAHPSNSIKIIRERSNLVDEIRQIEGSNTSAHPSISDAMTKVSLVDKTNEFSAHLSSNSGAHPSNFIKIINDRSSLVDEVQEIKEFSDNDFSAHPAASLLSNTNGLVDETNAIGAQSSFPSKRKSESVSLVHVRPNSEEFSVDQMSSAPLSSPHSAHPSFLSLKTSLVDEIEGSNNSAHPSPADTIIKVSLVDEIEGSNNSAHPSRMTEVRLVDEINEFSAHLSSNNGAHPFNFIKIISERSSLVDEIRQIVGSNNSAHPSICGKIISKKSSLLDEIRQIEGSNNSAHPSLMTEARLVDETNEFSAHLSSNGGAHPSICGKIISKKSSLLDEIRQIECSNNSAHPSPADTMIKVCLVDEIKGSNNSAHPSISEAMTVIERNLVEAEVEDPCDAHPSFGRKLSLVEEEEAEVSLRRLEGSEVEEGSHEDLRAYLQWFSLVYSPGIQLGRNKPPSDEEEEEREGEEGEGEREGEELSQLLERVSSALSGAPSRNGAPTNAMILRELTDIRQLLLQHILSQTGSEGGEPEAEVLKVLGALKEEEGGPSRSWTWSACAVCLDRKWLYERPCCSLPVCRECLKAYFAVRVGEGGVKVECPSCHVFAHRDEISSCLDPTDKLRFYHFLARANADPGVKTCPRCSHLTAFNKVKHVKSTKKHPARSRVVCSSCGLIWCFSCHAPWHPSLTCSSYRKGDRLMKTWANQLHHGQLNAQKCPKCQVYIQRSTGCDHMHCTRCECDFCYRCGDRLRKLRFFGDHYSKLSVFGCKFRYKADQPLQRKLVRGAVFGSKLMVAPLLGTLGACAGVIALGFGIFILPVYGGVRLYQKLSPKAT